MAELLKAGLAGFEIELSDDVIAQELRFLDELLRWNQRVNLTSIRDREEGLEKHLLDSLILLKYLPGTGRLLDMGSGGGFPGIPLAIARPGLQIVSVDSVGKKINFQKHIKRFLTLDNLQPNHCRLEDLKGLEPFDFVVARALGDFSTLVRLSAPLLRGGGHLFVMKGPGWGTEFAMHLASDGDDLYSVDAIHEYQLPESYSERHLIILTRRLR